MPRLGDVSGPSRCEKLKTMMRSETVRQERVSGRKTTHDRRPAADIGYKVWNTFEVELRTDTGGRRDEVTRAPTRNGELIER
jgi:hypothetical protein